MVLLYKAMRLNKRKNTKNNWVLHFMIYRSAKRSGWYKVVCLELALVREDKDPFKLINQINKLALHYVDSVKKNNLDDDLLNQELPKKYIDKYKKIEERARRKEWENALRCLFWENSNKERVSRELSVCGA